MRLTFAPSFHPEAALTIRQTEDHCEVEIVAFFEPLYWYLCYRERKSLGLAKQGRRVARPRVRRATGIMTAQAAEKFQASLRELKLATMGHQAHIGLDGIDVRCEYVSGTDFNDFVFGTPFYLSDPRYSSVARLALRASYDSDLPQWAFDLLEQIESYVSLGFLGREVAGGPKVFRLYGPLCQGERSVSEWEPFFARIEGGQPVIVDLRNVEGVALVLEDLFRAHCASANTFWVVPPGPCVIVDWLRVPAARVFTSMDQALAAMRASGHVPAAGVSER